MSEELKPGHVWLEVVRGPEGFCLYIGDDDSGYRLAGPKPWGGGGTVCKFQVRIDELVKEANSFATDNTSEEK